MNTSVDHDTAAMSSASPDVNSSSHTDGTGNRASQQKKKKEKKMKMTKQ